MTIFHRPLTRTVGLSPWWGLAGEFQRELNAAHRLDDDVFHGTRGVFPPVNLEETPTGYLLTAELPGVSCDEIDVQIEGSTITLSGQRKSGGTAAEGFAVHRRERRFGTFRRAFELPAEIDFDKAKATHKNGILTLELPKTAAVQPRQITVETR